MSSERLRELLGQVHAELEDVQAIDAEGRELLLATMGELAEALERSEEPAAPTREESLGDRLEVAARRFEVEHPRLFTAVQQIVDTLRGAGI